MLDIAKCMGLMCTWFLVVQSDYKLFSLVQVGCEDEGRLVVLMK